MASTSKTLNQRRGVWSEAKEPGGAWEAGREAVLGAAEER